MLGFTEAKASWALRIMKGALTNAIATTMPQIVSMNSMPMLENAEPIGEAGARIVNRAMPAVLCGIKIGMSMSESTTFLPKNSVRVNKKAKGTPKINMHSVAMKAQ